MSQFTLEIHSGDAWIPISGDEIIPESSTDELRLVLEKQVTGGKCVVRVTNGNKMRKPLIGNIGDKIISLGTVNEYVAGRFAIYLGSGGFQSQQVNFTMNDSKLTDPTIYVDGPKEPKPGDKQPEIYIVPTGTESPEEKEKLLRKLEKEKSDIEKDIEKITRENEKLEEQRQGYLSKSRQLHFDITDYKNTVKEKEEKLEEKLSELEKKNAEIAGKEKEIQEKDDRIKELEKRSTDVAQSLQELTAKRKALGLKDEEIDELNHEIQEKEKTIQQLKDEIAARTITIGEEEQKLNETETRLTVLKEQFNTRSKEETDTQEKNERLRKSLSKLQKEYQDNIKQIKNNLNKIYKECGLLEQQEKDYEESLKLLEIAAENDQFASAVKDIDAMKEKLEKTGLELQKIREIYKDAINKIEESQG